ncbi:type II secretion system protein [Clostridium thermobutyricum]|uniref:type II secretion system protein n=1 Tax=Clostridium thermobutyricum TaxID=29372 RepID=UPI0018A97896|nr:type II secretion system protein [Clostridium thermobutyricum]
MRKKIKKKKGYTLIEVVAGLAMFAIVSSVIMNMILDVNKYNAENKNQFDTSSMSRAFNEAIKNKRPKDNPYPTTWNGATSNVDGPKKTYYIGFNTIDDLNDSIKTKLLNKNFIDDNGKKEETDTTYTIRKIEGSETDKVEELSKKSYANKYKYGIKITVQKKDVEKVYLFDTDTIDVRGGLTIVTTRKFAISSIA